jgi:uncharacterized protein (DUF169 family)
LVFPALTTSDIVLVIATIVHHLVQAKNAVYARAQSIKLRTVPVEVKSMMVEYHELLLTSTPEKRTCRNCKLHDSSRITSADLI